MGAGRKMQAVREAAAVAVDALDDGVEFAVVSGSHEATPIYPSGGRWLARADASERQAAKQAIARVEPAGGTAIGTWLAYARRVFSTTSAPLRHAILLTDGRNEHQTPADLAAAIADSRGLFRCDCRGVGTDWEVDELRTIATALLGGVEIVADPAELSADFEALMASSKARALPTVTLRLWTPQGAVVESLRQVVPEVTDLTASGTPSVPQAKDFLLGDWSPGEQREYHVRITVTPGVVGDEMLAGRIILVLADGTTATQALVRAVWTEDIEKSTQMNHRVAHYTGQVELADAIQQGVAAQKAGDTRTATIKLGRAVQLAAASGHEDTLRLLKKVVDVDDAGSGTVRLRKDASKEATMTLDTRSTRTVRLDKPKPPGAAPDAPEGATPEGAPPDEPDGGAGGSGT
jgi:hypothetical protein